MIKNVTLGADPELFIQQKNGEIISAEGLIGGTKNAPRPINADGHSIQEDNVMVEFNIPASHSEAEFVDNINLVKDYLDTYLALQGLELNYSVSAKLDDKYLETEQAKTFGCDPDYNVYKRRINKAPSACTNTRCCGGHIHIGYDNPNTEDTSRLIKAMDVTLGLESVLYDADTERRKMYGKAGTFRFKEYGVEYRTLSNFWIRDNNLIKWAYRQTMKAIDLANSDKFDEIVSANEENIVKAINDNDTELAKHLINKLQDIKINKEEIAK